MPAIPSPGVRAVPTQIWVGSDDRALEDAKHVARVLSSCDVPVRLEIEEGRGHQMPEDLERVVNDLVRLAER